VAQLQVELYTRERLILKQHKHSQMSLSNKCHSPKELFLV
jgi:hypothetical protein